MKGLRLHGRNFKEIEKMVPTKTRAKIKNHFYMLLKDLKKDPNHPQAALLPLIIEPINPRWTEAEHELYIKGVRLYHKDWDKI